LVNVLVSAAPTVTETLLDATLKEGTLVNPHTYASNSGYSLRARLRNFTT
jgi:hypothetical protein